jgi:hypothetical protein
MAKKNEADEVRISDEVQGTVSANMAGPVEARAEPQDAGQEPSADPDAILDAGEADAPQGVITRKAWMPKHLIPSKEWLAANMNVATPIGTRYWLGRVFGMAHSSARKENKFADGRVDDSIVLKGSFEVESYTSGEVSNVLEVWLPKTYAHQVETILLMEEDGKRVNHMVALDCDIGMAATNKLTGYEWVVNAWRDGKRMDPLRRLRNSRPRPVALPSQALLTAPK